MRKFINALVVATGLYLFERYILTPVVDVVEEEIRKECQLV